METRTIHGVHLTIYKQEEMNSTRFGDDVLRFTKEGAVITNDVGGFGLYLKKGKWYLYRNKFKKGYSWDTLEEAVSSCLVLMKMEALP